MSIHNFLKSLFVSVIVFIFPVFSPAACALEEMTVEDAIRIGLKNNYNILIARNAAEIALNNKGRGTAGFLPSVNTSGNYQYSSANDKTGSPLRFGTSGTRNTRNLATKISLDWTLFDGFRMFVDRNKYDELAKLGEFQSRNIIENTIVSIMKAFYNLVQQKQLLGVARNTREISKTRLNRERARQEIGGVSKTDLLNAQVSFNNDQSTLLNQELQEAIASKNLNVILARQPSSEIVVKQEITVIPLKIDPDTLSGLALKHNSSLMVARQNSIVAEKNVALAKAAFYPRLILNANYGYSDRYTYGYKPDSSTGFFNMGSDFSADSKSHTIDANVGLILSFNLFNGNLDKIAYQNAKIEAKNQALELKDIQNLIVGLVREKLVTLQKRIETVELEQQNKETASQNLELQKNRHQIGIADSLDFRDAQVNLARAQATLIVARYQARITLLEIQQLIGKIEIK